MTCRRLEQNWRPAPVLHRWSCAECRKARDADAAVQLALACTMAEPVPMVGLHRVLQSLGLSASEDRIREHAGLRPGKGLVRVIVLVVLLAVAGRGWLWWLDLDPNIPVPNPKMPVPNAFDYFRRAGDMLDTNARPGGAMGGPSMSASSTRTGDALKDGASLREKELALRRNASALRTLRQGFAYEYREPPARSFDHLFPYLATYRQLARLLSVEASVYESKGDLRRANSANLDAIELGTKIQQGSVLIGKLVGRACEAMGRQGLWHRLDRMGESEAREAALRLESLNARRVPIADTLTEEKYATLAGLQMFFRDPRWRWSARRAFGFDNDRYGEWGSFFATLPHSKRAIVARYLAAMDWFTASARLYPRQPLTEPTVVASDPVNAVLMPSFGNAIVKDVTDDAMNRLLVAALGVQAYRSAHGRPPRTLEEVRKAGYIRNVPTDPFDPRIRQVPLRYLVRNGKPLLYSIGPDRVHNDGAPIVRRSANGRELYAVEADSVGDIVAGFNGP